MTDNTPDYSPNPVMEAAIEAKIEAAMLASGRDPKTMTEADINDLVRSIEWTPEETRYTGEQHLYKLAQIEIGRRMVQALTEHCRTPSEDIIPCIAAYFAALDAGEVEAA